MLIVVIFTTLVILAASTTTASLNYTICDAYLAVCLLLFATLFHLFHLMCLAQK